MKPVNEVKNGGKKLQTISEMDVFGKEAMRLGEILDQYTMDARLEKEYSFIHSCSFPFSNSGILDIKQIYSQCLYTTQLMLMILHMEPVFYLFHAYRSTKEIIEFCKRSRGFGRFLDTKRRTVIVRRSLPSPCLSTNTIFSAWNPLWTRIKDCGYMKLNTNVGNTGQMWRTAHA